MVYYCALLFKTMDMDLVALGALVVLPHFTATQIQDQHIISEYSQAYKEYNNAKVGGYDYHTQVNNPALVSKMSAFDNPDFYEKYENTVDPGKMYTEN